VEFEATTRSRSMVPGVAAAFLALLACCTAEDSSGLRARAEYPSLPGTKLLELLEAQRLAQNVQKLHMSQVSITRNSRNSSASVVATQDMLTFEITWKQGQVLNRR
jgi:hypothetical protein